MFIHQCSLIGAVAFLAAFWLAVTLRTPLIHSNVYFGVTAISLLAAIVQLASLGCLLQSIVSDVFVCLSGKLNLRAQGFGAMRSGIALPATPAALEVGFNITLLAVYCCFRSESVRQAGLHDMRQSHIELPKRRALERESSWTLTKNSPHSINPMRRHILSKDVRTSSRGLCTSPLSALSPCRNRSTQRMRVRGRTQAWDRRRWT